MASPTFSIKAKAKEAAFWNLISLGLRQVLLVASLVILGRLLTPASFGEYAIVTALTAPPLIATQLGLDQAILASKKMEDREFSEILSACFYLSFILMVLTWILSPWLESAYALPGGLLAINALLYFATLFSVVPIAILQRQLDFKRVAQTQVLQAVLQFAMTVGAAWAGFGTYALALGAVGGLGISGAIAWVRSKPPFRFRTPQMSAVSRGQLFRFGRAGLVSNLSNYVSNYGLALIQGRFWSTAKLGQYSFFETKYDKPFELLSAQISGALVPVLSKLSSSEQDLERMRKTALAAFRTSIVTIVPLYIWAALFAPYFIPLAFGEQWLPAIPVFQILCMIPLIKSFAQGANSILYALGLPQVSSRVALARMLVVIPGSIWVLGAFGDLESMAIFYACVDGAAVLIYLALALQASQISWTRYMREIRTPALYCGFFAAAEFALMRSGLGSNSALSILIGSAILALPFGFVGFKLLPKGLF